MSETVHPEVQRSMDTLDLSAVQSAIRHLGGYGLGVGIPYMRNEDGRTAPIPKEVIIFEDELQLSYLQSEDPAAQGGPVGWRWDALSGESRLNSGCGHWKCRVKTHCGPVPTPIKRAKDAIDLPEVQEVLRILDEYGLGIILPHMHDENGYMVPLPKGVISFEDRLQITFHSEDAPEVYPGKAVGWRWDPDSGRASVVTSARLSQQA